MENGFVQAVLEVNDLISSLLGPCCWLPIVPNFYLNTIVWCWWGNAATGEQLKTKPTAIFQTRPIDCVSS